MENVMKKKEQIYIDPELEKSKLFKLLKKSFGKVGGMLLVDENGKFLMMNEDYAQSMDISGEKVMGKNIADVIENTQIPAVLKSGKETLNIIFQRNGKNYWINRYPIYEDDKLIGLFAFCVMVDDQNFSFMRKRLQYLTKELNYYKDKVKLLSNKPYTDDNIVTQNPTVIELKEVIHQVAQTRSSVLLIGESGTGKEVFAGAIHALSPRKDYPFIKINCAAIPDNLLESELFGYVGGAFTGAIKGGKIGDFEAANGGTVFLDEVDSLTPNMQAKLLRVLQEREVKKVGSTAVTEIDVRFIFATNKDLPGLIDTGKFREDFYYRINVINLQIPPLRERKEDIPLLVNHFISKYNCDFNMNVTGIAPALVSMLQNYDWPGNIRELENCIERAFNYTDNGMLELHHFKGSQFEIPKVGVNWSLKEAREQAEMMTIRRVLKETGGNKKKTAEILGIERSQLYSKIKKYDL